MRRNGRGVISRIPAYVKLGLGFTKRLKPKLDIERNNRDVIAITHNVVVLLTHSKIFIPRRPRKYLKINNLSANTIFYAFDTPATALNDLSIPILSGGEMEYINPPYGDLYLIASVANSTVQILEHI